MENSFPALVDSAASILILLPTKPYFDQVAAGLSLYLSLIDKKEISISCPSPMMVGFNRLIGVDRITGEIGNKNLTIRFSGYDADNIEKVSYDIENGEFKLTIVPKAGMPAPQNEHMNLKYAGISADLVVLIGGANDTHFPILSSEELKGAKVVHIGNRILNTGREVISLAKSGATTSEIIANLTKESGLPIDPDIASNLIMGIEEGSSNFASSEVTPETFETFAYLLRSGGRRAPRQRLSPASFPEGAIPTGPFSTQKPKVQEETAPKAAFEEAPGTQEQEQQVSPPDDWLQPKIFKGTSVS